MAACLRSRFLAMSWASAVISDSASLSAGGMAGCSGGGGSVDGGLRGHRHNAIVEVGAEVEAKEVPVHAFGKIADLVHPLVKVEPAVETAPCVRRERPANRRRVRRCRESGC